MNTAFIKPARPGVLLRDPATGETIPPEGAAIVMGAHRAYWLRRVKDGDAVMTAEKPRDMAGTKQARPAAAAQE